MLNEHCTTLKNKIDISVNFTDISKVSKGVQGNTDLKFSHDTFDNLTQPDKYEYLLKDKNKANRTYYFFSAVEEDESLCNLVRYANRDPLNVRFHRVNLAPD